MSRFGRGLLVVLLPLTSVLGVACTPAPAPVEEFTSGLVSKGSNGQYDYAQAPKRFCINLYDENDNIRHYTVASGIRFRFKSEGDMSLETLVYGKKGGEIVTSMFLPENLRYFGNSDWVKASSLGKSCEQQGLKSNGTFGKLNLEKYE
jgi:hypothetical protein